MALDPTIFVHEKALCESESIGARTRIWAFAHVMPGAIIGEDCNICDSAFIESGAVVGDRVIVKNNVLIWDKVRIDDEVFLGPNVVFTNDMIPRVVFKNPPEKFLETRVRRGATIGANATVVCGVEIGEAAFVGAGTLISRDVPARALVVGNPARRIGWVCDCGKRLSPQLHCVCERKYTLISEQAGLAPA